MAIGVRYIEPHIAMQTAGNPFIDKFIPRMVGKHNICTSKFKL